MEDSDYIGIPIQDSLTKLMWVGCKTCINLEVWYVNGSERVNCLKGQQLEKDCRWHKTPNQLKMKHRNF